MLRCRSPTSAGAWHKLELAWQVAVAKDYDGYTFEAMEVLLYEQLV